MICAVGILSSTRTERVGWSAPTFQIAGVLENFKMRKNSPPKCVTKVETHAKIHKLIANAWHSF